MPTSQLPPLRSVAIWAFAPLRSALGTIPQARGRLRIEKSALRRQARSVKVAGIRGHSLERRSDRATRSCSPGAFVRRRPTSPEAHTSSTSDAAMGRCSASSNGGSHQGSVSTPDRSPPITDPSGSSRATLLRLCPRGINTTPSPCSPCSSTSRRRRSVTSPPCVSHSCDHKAASCAPCHRQRWTR